jgi:acetyl esterase/lipase
MASLEALITPSPEIIALYNQFQVLTTTYKKVGTHLIEVDILIPKTLLEPSANLTSSHPVIVKIHGGALITGSKSFLPWFGPWVLQLALAQNAVILVPNYRLIPEAKSHEIHSDIKDFFVWLRCSLPEFLESQPQPCDAVRVSSTRILVTGDSAGGYLTLLAALHQPVNSVRAVIAAYPSADLQDPELNDAEAAQKSPAFGAPILPPTIISDYIKSLKGDEIISDAAPPARMHLLLSASQQGVLGSLYGKDADVDPLRILDDLSIAGKTSVKDLPKIAIWHGTADSAVPYQGSVAFAKKANEAEAGQVLLHLEQGAEHGFDTDVSVVNTNTPWLREILDTIVPIWLG